MSQEVFDLPINKVDNETATMVSVVLIPSSNNIYVDLVSIPDVLKEKLPDKFRQSDNSVILFISDAKRSIAVTLLLTTDDAYQLATTLFILSSAHSVNRILNRGGDRDVLQRRTCEQEVVAFQEEGTVGEGTHSQPPDEGVKDQPAARDEGKEELNAAKKGILPA